MVERGFATLYSQMHAMMTHVVLQENLKTVLWPECAAITIELENIIVNPHEEKYTHEKFYREL